MWRKGGSKIDKSETVIFMNDPYLEHHMAAFNGNTRRSKVRGLGDKKGQNYFLDLFWFILTDYGVKCLIKTWCNLSTYLVRNSLLLHVFALCKVRIPKNHIIKDLYRPHCLGMNYYVNFLGGIGSNRFHIKWIFGTQDN